MAGSGSRRSPREQNEEEDPLQPGEDSIAVNPEIVPPMSALEILREAIRILRQEISAFSSILFLLICPVSAALLSDAFVSRSLAAALSRRLILAVGFAGLPPTHILREICRHVAGTVLSLVSCLPLLLSLLLTARALTAYIIACCYSGKTPRLAEFWAMLRRLWRRLLYTYLCIGAAVFSCLALFFAVVSVLCNLLMVSGLRSGEMVYPVLVAFGVGFAYSLVVGNLAGVVSVLEDSSGIEALLRSIRLARGRVHAGLAIFLGSTVGLVFVQGLFEHRVKYLSYGDGSSRIWEAPLLVLMHSFVILVDSMTNVVFYFTCRSEEVSENSSIQEMETVDAT
ncbi:uncharacterized protein LOC144702197 [Wolffia australiana]